MSQQRDFCPYFEVLNVNKYLLINLFNWGLSKTINHTGQNWPICWDFVSLFETYWQFFQEVLVNTKFELSRISIKLLWANQQGHIKSQ
jgi:hypothetical protein